MAITFILLCNTKTPHASPLLSSHSGACKYTCGHTHHTVHHLRPFNFVAVSRLSLRTTTTSHKSSKSRGTHALLNWNSLGHMSLQWLRGIEAAWQPERPQFDPRFLYSWCRSVLEQETEPLIATHTFIHRWQRKPCKAGTNLLTGSN